MTGQNVMYERLWKHDAVRLHVVRQALRPNPDTVSEHDLLRCMGADEGAYNRIGITT
jgi:hypothetical protein